MASISWGAPNPFSMTLAPLAARPRARPRPIPLVEPVTMADFPDSMAMTLRWEWDAGARAGRSSHQRCIVACNAQLLAAVRDDDVRYFLQNRDSGRSA